MIPGIDVSSVQGVVDWPKVAQSGIAFAYLKCTAGNDSTDPTYQRNLKGCRETGLYVGAYHFAYNLPQRSPVDGRTPQEEARRFFFVSGGLGRNPGELAPAVDAEWPEVGEWGKWGCTAKQISEWHRVLCEEVSQLWGRKPIIYTYPFWWRTIAASADVSWAAEYPLWIANYMGIDREVPPQGARPIIPTPWDDFTIWQWSANKGLRIPGIATDIDRNVWRGDLDGIRRFAGIEPEAPTMPEIPSRRPPRIEDFATVHPDVPVRGFEDDDDPDAA